MNKKLSASFILTMILIPGINPIIELIHPQCSTTTSNQTETLERHNNTFNTSLKQKRDSTYSTYNEFLLLLENLTQTYPHLIHYYSIGKTYEHRDIIVVKISDHVSIDEQEPEILYIGGVHGDEKPGYQLLIYSIQTILAQYENNTKSKQTKRIRNIVNNTVLYFIPMVNPDGIHEGIRKNKRTNDCIYGNTLFQGVDINRNFPYKWDDWDDKRSQYLFDFRTEIPFPFTIPNVKQAHLDIQSLWGEGLYRGPTPLSEPESKAIQSFIQNTSIQISVDYHATGEKILYPWSWTYNSTQDEPYFTTLALNISTMNGYDAIQGGKWYYINGAMSDWLYAEYHIYPFTIELCPPGMESPEKESFLKDLFATHLMVNIYVAEQAILLHLHS